MSKTLADNIERGRWDTSVLWDEAMLTMQEWALSESVSTILQNAIGGKKRARIKRFPQVPLWLRS